jgi:POT family proton-dependent oligopeptide transporter
VTHTTADPQPSQRTFFGHPWGLSTLFLTETWERFSYYGMRAILLYYMYFAASSGGLGMDHSTAKSLVSVYGAAIYMSGILGGWFADRIIGARQSITWGAVLIMGAHIALSVPGGGRGALFTSMVLLVVGTGLLKPNITKAVGDLYDEKDSRRDAGFTLFVMGVQIGAFISPLVIGALSNTDSSATDPSHNQFHLGFGLAAIGMAIGLVQYLWRANGTLGHIGRTPPSPLEPEARRRVLATMGGGALVLVLVILALIGTGNFSADLVVNAISVLAIIVPIGYFVVMLRSPKVSELERSRVRAFIPLFVAMVVFWFIEEQQSGVYAQYAEQQTDLGAWGIHLDPEWAQSINPIVMLVFAPVVATIWVKMGRRQPNTPRKFAIGLLLTGAGFAIMLVPYLLNGPQAPGNPIWLLLSIGVLSIGELLVNPVGLSASTALAPAAFTSQIVGLNYASDAAGQGLIAQVSKAYTPDNWGLYFGGLGLFVVVCAVALWFVSPVIHRAMAGVD